MAAAGIVEGVAGPLRLLAVLVKPAQTALLLFTMYTSYLAAGGPLDPGLLALIGASGFLAIGGTTAVNMVLDRDIDAVMPRTRGRPTASGSMGPGAATVFALGLYLAGAVLAHLVNTWFALAALLGFFFDIIVYTDIVKRRTWLNIVMGGVAGAMPALGGWAAARGSIGPGGLVLAGIVMAWIPMHIWFIATYYLRDYRIAGVPMAPVVLGPERASVLAEASIVVMVVLSALYPLLEGYGWTGAGVAALLGGAALARIEGFRRRPCPAEARGIFKFASPLLATVFTAYALEALLAAAP